MATLHTTDGKASPKQLRQFACDIRDEAHARYTPDSESMTETLWYLDACLGHADSVEEYADDIERRG